MYEEKEQSDDIILHWYCDVILGTMTWRIPHRTHHSVIRLQLQFKHS